MTFMGSTSNDSAFNAWVTDITTPGIRPKVEALLAVLPLVATVVVLVFNSLAQAKTISYTTFFIGLGIFVICCGVAGLFILDEPEHSNDGEKIHYFKNLIYTFRPSVIAENSRLYLTLAALSCICVAFQTFFPYFFIYIEKYLLPPFIDTHTVELSFLHVLAVIIGVIASVCIAVFFMKIANKNKKLIFIPSILILAASLIGAAISKNNIFFFVAFALPAVTAYFIFSIQLNALVRDFTPEGKAGLFQGIRMIFVVLIPMIIGPKLGEIASINSVYTYQNEVNATLKLPSPTMFIYAAIAAVVALVPLAILMKKGIALKEKKD